jgi:hypothetical protein
VYGWIWRHLPGPTSVKALIVAVGVLAVLTVCFIWVFPVISPLMPFNGSTVGE